MSEYIDLPGSIRAAPDYLQAAYRLMVSGYTSTRMAAALRISQKCAENYRHRVNRIVGQNRPWERRPLQGGVAL